MSDTVETEAVVEDAIPVIEAVATVVEVAPEPEFSDAEIMVIRQGNWYPTDMHQPFWGISGGKPHEFVMRQGGIVSMTHKTSPDEYMKNLINDGSTPGDEGIYFPNEAFTIEYINSHK